MACMRAELMAIRCIFGGFLEIPCGSSERTQGKLEGLDEVLYHIARCQNMSAKESCHGVWYVASRGIHPGSDNSISCEYFEDWEPPTGCTQQNSWRASSLAARLGRVSPARGAVHLDPSSRTDS